MIFLFYVALVFASVATAWHAWQRLRYFLHMFQLEGYKTHEYLPWLKNRRRSVLFTRVHIRAVGLLIVLVAVTRFWSSAAEISATAGLILWTGLFLLATPEHKQREKKPLAYTPRMWRLLSTAVGIALIPLVGGLLASDSITDMSGITSYLTGWLLASIGAPLWTLLAGYLMRPVERSIHEGFKRQARRKLAQRPDLTIIGITGSFGKTSTKHILAEILEQKYQVLATPASYNTPMGICIVVNEQLEDHHQILILEMGARYEGDIRELCELARPEISVVTSVGRAHLETLGSLEDVARVKGEIIRHMQPDGTAVLNADDRRVRSMASQAPGPVWEVSREEKPVEIKGRNLTYSTNGSSFEVEDDTGASAAFSTQLLGQHNMLNILLGTAVARVLGLRLRQIAHAVRRIEPIDHRLQLRHEGDITIIDDAFNANPVGARNAVEILGSFDDGRRIIVTPGMIELGPEQDAENRKLGKHIGRHVDLAVLVGEKQTQPIREGLEDVGYPADQIQTFSSLFEAQEFLEEYLRPGDTVLYENDLPDQYNEPDS